MLASWRNILLLSSELKCLGAWLQGRYEKQKSKGKTEKKEKGAQKEQIRPLGRSGKTNGLYKGHTDILSKVENGKQARRALSRDLTLFSGGKANVCGK
jgi:hypothetical protein